MRAKYGMSVTPTTENNWDKITDKPQEFTQNARTENIGRKVREVHYKTDDKGRHIKDADGKVHRKVGKPCKIVEASTSFYVVDNGQYKTCYRYEDEGREWEFVS